MKQHSRYQTARRILIFWTLFVGIGAVGGAIGMGCNACAERLFPEMREYTVGQPPRTISERFQKNVVSVVEQFAQTHSRRSHEHEHEKVHTLTLDGRQYDCMIHTLQNYYNKVVGYVVELRDET